MNQIRKIGTWIWLNKERMVLGVMLCFLVYRVYQVLNPQIEEVDIPMRPPRAEVNDSVELPGTPPPIPPPPPPQDFSRLYRANPFAWQSAGTAGSADQGAETDLEITLLRIREPQPGQYLVQIRTASRTGWYSEGDAFEAFELLSIDPDTGCVEVFAEQLAQTIQICVE